MLAEILRIEPETLRFGQAVRQKVQEQRERWEEGLSYQEREVLDAFLTLPVAQRKIVREVILAFSVAYPQADDEAKKK